jgi:hypothetical protein
LVNQKNGDNDQCRQSSFGNRLSYPTHFLPD